MCCSFNIFPYDKAANCTGSARYPCDNTGSPFSVSIPQKSISLPFQSNPNRVWRFPVRISCTSLLTHHLPYQNLSSDSCLRRITAFTKAHQPAGNKPYCKKTEQTFLSSLFLWGFCPSESQALCSWKTVCYFKLQERKSESFRSQSTLTFSQVA